MYIQQQVWKDKLQKKKKNKTLILIIKWNPNITQVHSQVTLFVSVFSFFTPIKFEWYNPKLILQYFGILILGTIFLILFPSLGYQNKSCNSLVMNFIRLCFSFISHLFPVMFTSWFFLVFKLSLCLCVFSSCSK